MRPATCRHDPGCGSELACIALGQAEGASYRRQADERRRDDEMHDIMYLAKRALKALEAIAAALERVADKLAPEPSGEERAARDRLKPR